MWLSFLHGNPPSLEPRKPLAELWKRTWNDPCLLQRWWNVSCPLHKSLGVWIHTVDGGSNPKANHLECINPLDNGINYLSTGAGFLPSTVRAGSVWRGVTELVGWPTTLLRLWLLWLFLLLLISHFVQNRNATVRIVHAQFPQFHQSIAGSRSKDDTTAEFHIIWVILLPRILHA